MDGFPRYELFGSKVARKFDYGIQDQKYGDPSQEKSKSTKDEFWDGGGSSLYDDLHTVHLREKPDWLVTMSLPDIDELFGFYFRRSYDDYRTPGLAKRDLTLQEVSGCDSSECSLKRDSDRRRKTLACLVLGIGALGILAGIIAVIFIMIISRPPDPITGGYVNITNPSHERNYTIPRPSQDSELYSRTQLSALGTNTANTGTPSTATLMVSPQFPTKVLVTNNYSTATSAFTSTALLGRMDPLLWTSPPSSLTKTTSSFSETRIPEFLSTLQTSWLSLETGFATTTLVTPKIGNTVDTLLPPGISNTIITSVAPSEGNANTTLVATTTTTTTTTITTTTTTGYAINISSIVKAIILYPEDNTIITSAKLVSENTAITSTTTPTANTVRTSMPLATDNKHISSVMANTILTSPSLTTGNIMVMSGSLATKNTNIISMSQVTENTLMSSMPKVTENTVHISVPRTAINTIVTLATPLSGDGSVTSSRLPTGNGIGTSTPSTPAKTTATSAAQTSLVTSTSVGGNSFGFSPLTTVVPNSTPAYTTPTTTVTPATVTLPGTLFSSDPSISEGIFSNSGFSGGMSSNSNLLGRISPVSTAVHTGLPASATVKSSMSVTWSTVVGGSSGKSGVVPTLMSGVTSISIMTGTATQRPDTSTVGAKTTTATSGSPSLSSQMTTTPSIVTAVTTRTVTPPTSPPVTLPSAASATAMLTTGLQQTTTRTDLFTPTPMLFTAGVKIVSLAPSTPGIAATPVVTTVLPRTVVLSDVTVVSTDRVTPAATATSTITITAPTVAPTTKAAGATSTFMTTPAPIFQSTAISATATTTTTTAVLPTSQTSKSVTTSVPFISSTAVRATSSMSSVTPSRPASTAGSLATTVRSSSFSLGLHITVSASLLPSTTSETMKVSDPATRLLTTTTSTPRLVPVSTNIITTSTATTNGIRQTMTLTTSHTSIAASTTTTIASTTTTTPTTIPAPTISPSRTTPPTTSNPTMFPSLLSTMPTLTTSLALTSTATSTTKLTVPTVVSRTSSSVSTTFTTAVVVTTRISSSPPTTAFAPSPSSVFLKSTSVTTPASSLLTSTTTLMTTTIPSTTTPPKSEILFMDSVLELYKPGKLSCTHIGNDWSFVVLLRNDTDTIAGYQNVFGCTQMVGCNTFLANMDLEDTQVGFNNTFTLIFNNVSCSDQRLYTCQEVIVGLTASAFVKVEVPKSLQRLEISVPSTISSSTPTTVSCSARVEAESGSVFWEIADPGSSTFVHIVLSGASRTEAVFDECLRDVTLRARQTFSASQNGAKLRCRTIFPESVSPEVVLNIV